METINKDDLIAKVPKLTREQFELRLLNIESAYALAFEQAKAMDFLEADARERSRQRRMNMVIENMICALMDETNITVNVEREERNSQIPFPPHINHQQTMMNYDANR